MESIVMFLEGDLFVIICCVLFSVATIILFNLGLNYGLDKLNNNYKKEIEYLKKCEKEIRR